MCGLITRPEPVCGEAISRDAGFCTSLHEITVEENQLEEHCIISPLSFILDSVCVQSMVWAAAAVCSDRVSL